METPILQRRLLDAPWGEPSFRRLPGMRPVGADEWLVVDDAYAAQMALRERLLDGRRDEVIGCLPGTEGATAETLEEALGVAVRSLGFHLEDDGVLCPDGRRIVQRRDDPLDTLGRLFQEDFCVMERRGDEHVLTAAVLCFPSGWTLSQKLGRPLMRIHLPVTHYDDEVGRRVQRLFDGLKPGRPLMRSNLLWKRNARLFAPRREGEPRPAEAPGPEYLRSERQCLVRLPRTDAVLFTIHTCVIDAAALTAEERAILEGPPAGGMT